MIRAIGWLIKLSLFSVLVLVLGNWVHWGGRTVSDQVKTQISHAERSQLAGSLRRWTSGVTEDARKGARRLTGSSAAPRAEREEEEKGQEVAQHAPKKEKRPEMHPSERIQSSERQKLRALIEELNTSSPTADRRASR